MREEILKRFFEGSASVSDLSADIKGSTEHFNALASRIQIEDMQEEFAINRKMLVALCDAVSGDALEPEALNTIGFALLASDSFTWDGDRDDVLANVISDWSSPEINSPLTKENVVRFRKWLLGDEPYPTTAFRGKARNERIVSFREKVRKKNQ